MKKVKNKKKMETPEKEENENCVGKRKEKIDETEETI